MSDPTLFLVNGEGANGVPQHYAHWDHGEWGTAMQPLVTAVDEFSFTVQINPELAVGDTDAQGNGDGQVARPQQRVQLANALAASGRDVAAVRERFARIPTVLRHQGSTAYNLEAVRGALENETLPLEDIMSIPANSSNDDFVAGLLRAAGLDPRQYRTEVIQGFAQLGDNIGDQSIEDITSNAAFQAYAQEEDISDLPQEQREALTAARTQLTTLRAAANRPPAPSAEDQLAARIQNASLAELRNIVASSTNRRILRNNTELRAAFSARVRDIISSTPATASLSAHAIRDLAPYLELAENETLITFAQGDRERVCIIRQEGENWVFAGDTFTGLSIAVTSRRGSEGNTIVVREDGDDLPTVVIATRETIAGDREYATLFRLGINVVRAREGFAEDSAEGRSQTFEEVERINGRGISRRLFDAIDTNHDGKVSARELRDFDETVNGYSEVYGITIDQAYEVYAQSSSFTRINLANVREARREIAEDLEEGTLLVRFDLVRNSSNEQDARLILASGFRALGVQEQVAQAALDAFFNEQDFRAASADIVTQYLLRVELATRINGNLIGINTSNLPENNNNEHTTRGILAYIFSDESAGPNSAAGTNRRLGTRARAAREPREIPRSEAIALGRRIMRNPAYRNLYFAILDTDYRSFGQWTSSAVQLTRTLLEAGEYELAEALPWILQAQNREFGASVLSRSSEYNAVMAEHLFNDGEYEAAFAYASRIEEQGRKEQVMGQLLDACISALPPDRNPRIHTPMTRTEILELAFEVMGQVQTRRQEQLQNLARAAIGYRGEAEERQRWEQEILSESGQVNQESLAAYQRVHAIRLQGLDLFREIGELNREFEVQSGNERLPVARYIQIEERRLRRPMEIQMLADLVFPGDEGEEANLEHAEVAIRRLDAIVSNPLAVTQSESAVDLPEGIRRAEVRIHAFTLIANIRRSQGKILWTINPTMQHAVERNRRAFQFYVRSCQAARMATFYAMVIARTHCLDDNAPPSLRSLATYFNELHRASNDIPYGIFRESRTLVWNDTRGNDGGAGEFPRAVRREFERLLQELVQYMPEETWCNNPDRDTADTQEQISSAEVYTQAGMRPSRRRRVIHYEHPRDVEHGFFLTLRPEDGSYSDALLNEYNSPEVTGELRQVHLTGSRIDENNRRAVRRNNNNPPVDPTAGRDRELQAARERIGRTYARMSLRPNPSPATVAKFNRLGAFVRGDSGSNLNAQEAQRLLTELRGSPEVTTGSANPQDIERAGREFQQLWQEQERLERQIRTRCSNNRNLVGSARTQTLRMIQQLISRRRATLRAARAYHDLLVGSPQAQRNSAPIAARISQLSGQQGLIADARSWHSRLSSGRHPLSNAVLTQAGRVNTQATADQAINRLRTTRDREWRQARDARRRFDENKTAENRSALVRELRELLAAREALRDALPPGPERNTEANTRIPVTQRNIIRAGQLPLDDAPAPGRANRPQAANQGQVAAAGPRVSQALRDHWDSELAIGDDLPFQGRRDGHVGPPPRQN